MTLEAPRPLLGAGVKMKKIMAYLNNFLGKKLFYIENLTKLPELTVFKKKFFILTPKSPTRRDFMV
jgi:hypothetical protein